jgi:serine/threonine protein kinase/methyl-accepting chemotaxis protein
MASPRTGPRPGSSSSEELRVMDRVGEYEITARIAQGGMGTVYAATHPVIHKKAAIKVLKRSLCAHQEVVERFIDEARAVNQIGHANIVDVFAFGVLADGRSYFVMEWLEGRTLYEHLRARDLRPSDQIEILDQLSDALDAAHDKGIVHRDIKPENVFLVQERSRYFVKLLDFGVAKLGMGTKHASEGVAVLGTPAYISPEQASAQEVDRKTDIYSLGVIAFELFTGRRPFEAERALEMMAKHIHHKPPHPRDVKPSIPPILDELVFAMLAKDPKERPELSRVREVLAELRVAAMLEESGEVTGSFASDLSSARPLLARRYARISSLSHSMIAELSRGAAWIEAEGRAPPQGTPITVRFQVDEVGAHVDFGGIVSRFFGGSQKALIRYDRVSKERLDHIFSIVASARTIGPPSSDATEIAAVWESPESAPSSAKPASASASVPVYLKSELPKRADAEGGPGPRKASLFGLGAKVLALTALVTIGAVISVTSIALDRARTDRRFYDNELGIRISALLADLLSERLDAWKSRLLLAAAGGNAGRFDLGDFESLSICEHGRCEKITGEPPSKEAMARALEARDLSVLKDGSRIVLSASADKTQAVATVSANKLLDLRGVPQYLGVFALDADKRVLAARRIEEGAFDRIEQHEIIGDLDAHAKSRAGAREYTAPDGTPMLGAWTRARDLAVIVALPSKLSEDQLRVLTKQVLVVAAIVLAGAMIVALIFARTMTRRLRLLTRHATRVAAGDFSARAGVSGGDEVGQLAGSFQSMTEALKQRDGDVLRIRDKITEDESEALHRQMSEWLETDLASTLSSIHGVVRQPVNEADPLRDLAQRTSKLDALAAQASASLQHALAFAAIASRRIDLAATVEDAVAYARTLLFGSKVKVELEAKNAVLFPRLDAKESEIREMVQALIMRAAKLALPDSRITIELSLSGGALSLDVPFSAGSGAKEAADAALEAVSAIVGGHGASGSVREDVGGVFVSIAFPAGAAREAEPVP